MTYYRIADRIQMAALMNSLVEDDSKRVGERVGVRSRVHRFGSRSDDGRIEAQVTEETWLRERTELATWLRCSVLDTLRAIQLAASEPDRVIYLARCQEREMKRTIAQLMSRYEEGLQVALLSARDDVEDLHQVRIDALVQEDLPLDVRISAVVGAAREAMHNAARHSRSETIEVLSELRGGSLVVIVRDHGVGFDPSLMHERGASGLSNSLIRRVEKVGGTVDIASSPGSGTKITIRLPSVPQE